jgi:hypothetical protein
MISSRCKDRFPLSDPKARELSAIREQLKEEIEEVKIFGTSIYEVWINELAIGPAIWQAWDECMLQARICDIFISLFNGNAGWPDKNGTVGICHAEFMEAYSNAPGKVFIVNIFQADAPQSPKEDIDVYFQNYIISLKRFEARASTNEEQLLAAMRSTVSESTLRLAQRGVRDASRGVGYVGPALDWSRQDYRARIASMKASVLAGLDKGTRRTSNNRNIMRRSINGHALLFVVNAIPDAMSVPAAREVVGQPQLLDHTLLGHLARLHGGPIHLIACHKNVTEAQAIPMLGFPNATVVSAPFGIYVVDTVQSIQLVLIAQCRDETTTRHGVQRFLEWLDESEQAPELVRHAAKRKVVVKALASS